MANAVQPLTPAVAPPATRRGRLAGVTPNVFWLGVVSFLTDVSSEMTLTILPLFLANVLGASTAVVGLIEGIAETTASLTKLFSGWLSDRLGRRKAVTVVGYGLSAVSKPFLYFAAAWGMVLAVRFSDRLGKGVRTSARDALLADSAPPEQRGLSFGFHRAADTAGALLGLLLTTAIVWATQQGALELSRTTYQQVMLVGIVPGFLAVAVLVLLVRERRPAVAADEGRRTKDEGRRTVGAWGSVGVVTSHPAPPRPHAPTPTPSFVLRPSSGSGFDFRFKAFLLIVVLFTLGNSSDAFLILRAQSLGSSVVQISIMLVAFNLIYTAVATPAGALSDRVGRKALVVGGWAVYGLIYLGFAAAQQAWQAWVLFALYGLYYGAAEGTARALVADVVPAERRGTAYGLYNTAIGITALPASVLAGLLWQGAFGWSGFGAAAPFYFGAALALLASVLLLAWMPSLRQPSVRTPEP